MEGRGEGKKEPVKVVDRRSFTADGKKRDPQPDSGQPGPAPESAPPPGAGASAASPSAAVAGEGFTMEPPAGGAAAEAAEDAALLNLVISLYNTGCVHLGLASEGREGAPPGELDLDGARGMIELLAAIKRKTQGNLSTDESRIIESLLADLQMAYVMKARRS